MESTSCEETFVGLDVHRTSILATAVESVGHRLSQVKCEPSNTELVGYLRTLPGRKHAALEAGSTCGSMFDAASSIGATVVLSNPVQTRLIAEASLRTDRIDSAALATLLRVNAMRPTENHGRLREVAAWTRGTSSAPSFPGSFPPSILADF